MLGTVTIVTSHENEGKIVKQSIEPGTKAEQGTVVNIEVSDGKGVEQTIVPQLIGSTPDEAKDMLTALKLTVGDVTYEERSDMPENVVFWQSIARDTEVSIYTEISIKVSKGTPPPPEEPDDPAPSGDDDTSGDDSSGEGGGESGGDSSGEGGGESSGDGGSGEGSDTETGN